MDLISKILKEAKQVGELYHFTSLSNLEGIILTNTFHLISSNIKGKKRFGFSTTRNKNLWKKTLSFVSNEVRLTLNGDKISEIFKIIPYNDFPGITRDIKDGKKNEYEERVVVNQKFLLKKYLLKVTFIIPNFTQPEKDYKNLIKLIDLLKKENISFDFIGKLNNQNYLKEVEIGEYLFADDYEISSLQKGEYEKNTPDETNLIDDIYDFVRLSNDNTKENIKSVIKKLEPLKSKYPEILSPKTGQKVFRGLVVSLKDYFPHELIDFNNVVKISGKEWFCVKNYIYDNNNKHGRGISSWTTKPEIALSFSREQNFRRGRIGVLLETKVDDSFFFSEKFLNIISQKIYDWDENEIICYKNKINCIMYILKEDYEEYIELNNTDNE